MNRTNPPEAETEIRAYTPEEQFSIIEACLFAAGHPLTYARLAEVLGITPAACADVVEKMAVVYNNADAFPQRHSPHPLSRILPARDAGGVGG